MMAQKAKKRKSQQSIHSNNTKKMKNMDKWEEEMRLQLKNKDKEIAALRKENREMYGKAKDAEHERDLVKTIYSEKFIESTGKEANFSRAEKKLLKLN